MLEWVSAASEKAAARHLTSVFGEGIQKLAKPLHKDPYHDAMVKAFEGFSEIVISYLQVLGNFDDDLKPWLSGIEALIDDPVVADELWSPLVGEDKDNSPNIDVLRDTWNRLGGEPMPQEFRWEGVASSYRKQVERQRIIDKDLRPQLNIEELVRLRKAVQGAAPTGDIPRYAARMRTKYRILDLTNFIGPTEDQPNRGMLLREAFIPQLVREDPPPVEVPRDLVQKLVEHGEWQDDALDEEIQDKIQAERVRRLQTEHIKKPARPVLHVVTEQASNKLVVVGGPGSGKSALTRFLLLKTLDTIDGALPLLIELRDFHAERQAGHCDDFLSYCHYLGKDQGYFLNETWLADRLETESSLVLFDGLDEIFESEARRKISEAIIGFGHRFSKARILVTTRPVGYQDGPFRNAGFRHVALEELTKEQIEKFVRGWFGRLFDDERPAEQRIQRVLGAAERSKSIRLLAGNPMLLTIMCLIAQQRELPRDRVRFYEQAADVLCHHWDANRRLKDANIDIGYIDLDDKRELLRKIAFRMQAAEGGLAGNFIRESDLRDEITTYLERRYDKAPDEAKVASKALIDQLRERNYVLCLRGPNLYGFVHRTFLEYFCAAELIERLQVEGQLTLEQLRDDYIATHWHDKAWHEPLRLICGMLGAKDAEALILFLVEEANTNWFRAYQVPPPRHLGLAVQCLAEQRDHQTLVNAKKSIAEAVVQFFELPNFSSYSPGFVYPGLPFRTLHWADATLLPAILELPQGWASSVESEPLVSRLAFRANPQIRITYARVLAHLHPNRALVHKVLEEQTSKGSEPFLRSAAIAALASVRGDDDTKALIADRAKNDTDDYARQAAIEALASEWSDDSTKTFIAGRATRDRHSIVRSAAVKALASVWGDEDAKALVADRATKDTHSTVRRVAVSALAAAWADEDTKALITKRLTRDPNFNVRAAAVKALASAWGDEDAKTLVMEGVKKEASPSVRAAAVIALVSAWDSEDARALITERIQKDTNEHVRSAAVSALASTWDDEHVKTLIMERLTKDPSERVRQTAVSALASAWGDEDAKTLITERMQKDKHPSVRSAAVSALTSTWGDEDAKILITKRIQEDKHYDVRSAAISALASVWDNEETKALISERVRKDKHSSVRSAAVEALASAWGDEDAKALIIEQTAEGAPSNVRRAAVTALATTWCDEDAKTFIVERIKCDANEHVRRTAVSALASAWGDSDAKDLIASRTKSDTHSLVRSAAVEALAFLWGEDDAKTFIAERIKYDANEHVRRTAVEALTSVWGDSDVKDLILERIQKDTNENVRANAVLALASTWGDDDAKTLVAELASIDTNEHVRAKAIEALASAWSGEFNILIAERIKSDKSTKVRRAAVEALASTCDRDFKNFIAERASNDKNEHVRRTAVSALAIHYLEDEAARFLLSKKGKHQRQFLDPQKPTSNSHIRATSLELGWTEDEVRSRISSYKDVLGWDPLVGCG